MYEKKIQVDIFPFDVVWIELKVYYYVMWAYVLWCDWIPILWVMFWVLVIVNYV